MNPGDMIGHRYKIIRPLGEGGMANVYLAYDTVLDRQVSVKVLRLDLRDDPNTKRRFRREAMSATKLNDPHIVGKTLCLFRSDGFVGVSRGHLRFFVQN